MPRRPTQRGGHQSGSEPDGRGRATNRNTHGRGRAPMGRGQHTTLPAWMTQNTSPSRYASTNQSMGRDDQPDRGPHMRGTVDASPTTAQRQVVVLPSVRRRPSLGRGQHTTRPAWMPSTPPPTIARPNGNGEVSVSSSLASCPPLRSRRDSRARASTADPVRAMEDGSQPACLASGPHVGTRTPAVTGPSGRDRHDADAEQRTGSSQPLGGVAPPESSTAPTGRTEFDDPSVGSRRGRPYSSESPSPRPRSRSRHNYDRPAQANTCPRNTPPTGSHFPGILQSTRPRSESPHRTLSGRPRQRLRVSFSPNTRSPPTRPSRGRNIFSGVIAWIRGGTSAASGSNQDGHRGGDSTTAGSTAPNRSAMPTTPTSSRARAPDHLTRNVISGRVNPPTTSRARAPDHQPQMMDVSNVEDEHPGSPAAPRPGRPRSSTAMGAGPTAPLSLRCRANFNHAPALPLQARAGAQTRSIARRAPERAWRSADGARIGPARPGPMLRNATPALQQHAGEPTHLTLHTEMSAMLSAASPSRHAGQHRPPSADEANPLRLTEPPPPTQRCLEEPMEIDPTEETLSCRFRSPPQALPASSCSTTTATPIPRYERAPPSTSRNRILEGNLNTRRNTDGRISTRTRSQLRLAAASQITHQLPTDPQASEETPLRLAAAPSLTRQPLIGDGRSAMPTTEEGATRTVRPAERNDLVGHDGTEPNTASHPYSSTGCERVPAWETAAQRNETLQERTTTEEDRTGEEEEVPAPTPPSPRTASEPRESPAPAEEPMVPSTTIEERPRPSSPLNVYPQVAAGASVSAPTIPLTAQARVATPRVSDQGVARSSGTSDGSSSEYLLPEPSTRGMPDEAGEQEPPVGAPEERQRPAASQEHCLGASPATSPPGSISTSTTPGPEPPGEETSCCICFDAVSERRICLNECNHELCLECYAQAAVREHGDSLCCPICRVSSSVSTTNENARNIHGDDTVTRAFDVARQSRNTVFSASRETRRIQAAQPQTYCDICHGVIEQHAIVRMPCECRFHRRCAVGHVEDRLQRALDTSSDRIDCAQPVQHTDTYNPRIRAFLSQITQLGQSEGEEAERSIASRVTAIEDQLGPIGLHLDVVDLAEDNREAGDGDQRQGPVPLHCRSPPESPDPQPRPDSPQWIPRPRLDPTGAVNCSVCHQGTGPSSVMIQVACSCWVHRNCALTFIENGISAGCSNGDGLVTCPNPATHDEAPSVFLPRLFEQVTNRHVMGEDELRGRIEILRPRVQQLHDVADRVTTSPPAAQEMLHMQQREARSTISDTTNAYQRPSDQSLAGRPMVGEVPTAVPEQRRERHGNNGDGSTPNLCSYCERPIDLESRDAGEVPIPIPCGHGGMIHARCLWIRASHMAHGHRDRNPCSQCSEEPPSGRRPPHPAELVHNHVLPAEGGRWDVLRTLVSVWNAMGQDFEIWAETERVGRTVGSFNSFEDMVRAHGRSPTSSYLLVPIFGSALGLGPPTYVDFPMRGMSVGWTQVIQCYRDLFQRLGIQPRDVLIELPNNITYICPHVQEYLVRLDPVWESHLTFYTSGVQRALTRPGTRLPPFPQLQGGLEQRGRDLIQQPRIGLRPMAPSANAHGRSEPSIDPVRQQRNGSRRERGQISGVGVPPVEFNNVRRARSAGPTLRRTPDTTCGGCSEVVTSGHRVVRQSCGHVYHARCIIHHFERSGARSNFVCGTQGCGQRHPRRETIDAAMQADAGLRQRVERLARGTGDEPVVEEGLLFPWDQNSPGIGLPLDNVTMEDLKLRIETVKKVKPLLAIRHARLTTHVLRILNKTLAETRSQQASSTSVPLLRAIKLWYLTPGLLHSFDGKVSRKERFKSMERGDISQLLPWLIDYTKATATRHREGDVEESKDQRFKRASAACRHSGGIKDAARALLAEPRSPGTEATWTRLQSKFPHEDPEAINEAITQALTECEMTETDSTPRWRPEQEFNPHTLIEVANSRSSNSGAGNDGHRFAHIKSIANTVCGREDFFPEASKLWRRLVTDPKAFPPEFWALWKQANLIALGDKCRPVCIGMTMRRLVAAGISREWKPKLEETFREANQFGVAVAGGVDHMSMKAQVMYQTGHWIIQTDCTNAFNSVKRTAIIREAARSVPELTGFIAKCYDGTPATAVYTMDSGERRTIECASGVQQGDGLGPSLYCLPMNPILKTLNEKYQRLGVEFDAYMDDIFIFLSGISEETVQAFPDLETDLREHLGVIISRPKSIACPPQGHIPSNHERGLLSGVELDIANQGIAVVGVPVGTDEYAKTYAMEVVKTGGAENLAKMLASMPDRQVAHLVATFSLTQRTAYVERGLDSQLSIEACTRLDNACQWAFEKGLELEGTAEEEAFFENGCPSSSLKLKPHQKAQAQLSTGAGGMGLASAALRRISASLGYRIASLPEVIASLQGPLGESVKNRLPGTSLVQRIGDSIRHIHHTFDMSEDDLKKMIPPSWVSWSLETQSRNPTIVDLAAHDGETTTSRKAQQKIGKALSRINHKRFIESLDNLPSEPTPPTPNDPFSGTESKEQAQARVRSSQGQGAHAWVRAMPTDRSRVIPPTEHILASRRAVGIEEFLANGCPRCHHNGNSPINTQHARTCPRDGQQVNQHEPLKHAISSVLNSLSVQHELESGAPFTTERNLSMDIVVRRGALRDASSPAYRNKGILLDVTHADPQAQVHLRGGSATNDGKAAQTSEARKRRHYARPGHVSFDERSFKLTTFAVESFGRLGEEGYKFIDELATHAAGGRNGPNMCRRGIIKERILQVVSVATQVAISRRVHRYKLSLRGRQHLARRQQDANELPSPMTWGWSVDEQ